jgi:hypothetical protein
MKNYMVTGLLACLIMIAQPAFSDEAVTKAITKTVEAIHTGKAELKGKIVKVHGKVVKVNNNIMKRNFLHIQDGTGGKGTNDVTVTSNQTANVGDEVTVTGRVVLNRDFGFGYLYPILLEQATIEKHQ